jgi:predicted ATPase/class 3 adenylate cyclase/DNA-binding CsgD family transcriptional regulator
MTSNPSGTVTFLFTDIENSTKLAREYPQAWEAAQARHHAILREAIESSYGFVFQIVGDAFCAAFHKAGDALKAALTAQQNLQNEIWGEITVYVRMGIHTGEAESEGDDYHGYTTLSFVQRLMSAGHGGQILVSGAAENLLREQLPEGISLRNMGMQKFAGVPLPMHVFQVIAPDLPTEFPPLRTLDNLPNNLPIQLTSFVGRENELADIRKLLHDARLLTLMGPGGTGKTRLSIQAASEMLDQYADGVWFVELAPILDPELVPRTTAIAIGLRDEPQRPVIDMLCDYLHEKKILIVLDNCEHLVDACARMADRILYAAPDTRILASSREALGIGGEVSYRVPSLEFPDISHLPSVEALNQYEAVKLFIDRATAAVPTFTVTNDNAPALAQVCHHLDGIPLAIELAAPKIRVLSVDQIAKRLDDRFRLLIGGSRTVLERHQTLRAAIDWSYNLLSPAEQVLFQRLSVFVGGWTLEAAESVCEGGSVQSDDILNLLEQLINKSLVIKEEAELEARYHMLETIRQYANEKLLEAKGDEALRDKHLTYFVKLVNQAEPELYRSNQVFWLNKLDDELDNFRMALERSLATDVESGLRLIVAQRLFWDVRGDIRELEGWLARLLGHYTKDNSLRAQALVIYGRSLAEQGDLTEAYKIANQSLELARAISDKQAEAFSLWGLGTVLLWQGDFIQGTPIMEQSLALYQALGNKLGQATATGYLCLNTNDLERSKTYVQESLRLYRELGHLSGIAICLRELAMRTIWGGNLSLPTQLLEEARTIYRQLGDQSIEGEATILQYYGTLSFWQADYQEAYTYHEESLKLYEKAGNYYNSPWARVNMAYDRLRQGNISKAKELFEISIEGFQKTDVIGVVYAIEGLASLNVNQEQPQRAERLFAWADAMREKINNQRPPIEQKSVEKDLSVIHSKLGDAEFEKFSEEGRAMTVEQAIALSLEPVEEIIESDTEAENRLDRLPSRREADKQKYGGLTTREREVASQIAQGKSNQAIAAELFVGLKTVEAHVTRILSKLGFTSRAQIAGWAVAKGLAEAPRGLGYAWEGWLDVKVEDFLNRQVREERQENPLNSSRTLRSSRCASSVLTRPS